MADSNNLNWERISELYSLALEMPADQWQSWLQTQCNEQEKKSGLDTYLLKMLKSSPRADAFFDALNRNIEEDYFRHKDMDVYKPGDTFDKFRVIKEIGHGGMSKVFLCQRDDGQFDQTVAIKVMKVRGDTEFMKDRFRQEQQILAGINHAHIAQLYDGGITEQGHPYIIMEYVEGEAIDIYCKRKNLGIRDRIRLFIQVCDALQYAHSKLIVHHDIKPANIMVNNQGKVKLLDFGISQVLFSQEKAEVKKTSFEGTLQYASPEQFDGAGPSVASDVYKLGLVLYNLLTGRIYNFREEKQNFRDELFENQGAGSEFNSRHRRNSLLLSDLDAILRKCLQKEPSQRFESVSAISHDLQNTLTNHALHSHPPKFGYRLRKSYARNKAKVWMFTVFNLALLVSLVFLVSQFRQTFKEKERAEHILEFVWDVFESADPEVMQGDTITVYQLLENSIPRIEELDKQPELQAELYYVTGRIYTKLGFWDRGGELYYMALDISENLPQKTDIQINKAKILTDIASYRRNVADYKTADSLVNLAIETFQKYERFLLEEELAHAIRIKANIKRLEGNHSESIELSEKVLKILNSNSSDPNLEKIAAKTNLANSLRHLGRYEEADKYMKNAISMIEQMNQDINHIKLTAYGDYASLLGEMGQYEKALEYNYNVYNIQTTVYGKNAPVTLISLLNLAATYFRLENYIKSDSINLYLLDKFSELFGENHNYTVSALFNLSSSMYAQKNFEKALYYQKMVLKADIKNMGENHPYVAETLRAIGKSYLSMNEIEKAEDYCYKALDVYKHNFGEKHRFISLTYSYLASINCKKGNYIQCRDYFDKAIEMAIETVGEDHFTTQNIRNLMDEYAHELALLD